MSQFKADAEKSEPSGDRFLQIPYKGPVDPVSVEKRKVGQVENCFVLEVKLLGEDIKGNDVSGIKHEWVGWNPEGKGADKIENAVNRLAYVVSHFAPKEEVLAIEANSWEEYVDKQIRLFHKHSGLDRDDIEMKFIGDVYKDNAKITTPGYHNFIANEDSDQPLQWSQSEQEGNREYLEVKNSTPTDPEDAEHVEDLGDQKF